MTQPRIQRFDFNKLRDFRGPIVVNTALNEEEIAVHTPPPPPVFTLADIDAARMAGKKEGYNEGFEAGKLEAERESDHKAEQANEVIRLLGETMRAAHADYRHILTHESAHVNSLTLTVAKKIASEALDTRAEETITAIIERCMPVIFSKPRLMVELHPDVFERAVDRIESTIRADGFEGEIQFRTNETLRISDLSLNWGSGEMNRSTEALWLEIETLLERIPLELTFAETLETPNTPTGA